MDRRHLPQVGFFLGFFALGLLVVACGDLDESSSSSNTSAGGNAATTDSLNGIAGNDQTTTPSTTADSSCTAEDVKFSFFLASQAALVRESGNADGFGGDLGGIAGADAICQRIAETSAPCHRGTVVWHAFLSTASVNAKGRIGRGPWYDRRGRLLASNLVNLLANRPVGADSSIVNDLPNENGTPNHKPDGKERDNHQIITGTGTDGNVYTQTASGSTKTGGVSLAQNACLETWSVAAATCKGWTTNRAEGCPRVGHSWPALSGINWISVWNESGCAPGGTGLELGGTDSSRRIGSAGGYGGFYCFAVTGS